ncbi:MAG: TetR/AcrR family transcriptional regulator [Proteobacteria bacterium]|nr:TetR/AcrR family transcriptional regulator [Pseudomonadota bacterium]
MAEKKSKREIKSQVENKELIKKWHTQIVGAASELFSQKGYHRTTLRDISAASKINISDIYRYISSKDDILYLFYLYLYEQWVPAYDRVAQSSDADPIEQMKDLIESILEFMLKWRSEMLTLYTESRHLEKESLYAVLSMESRTVRLVQTIIDRGVEKGVFNVPDTFMAANIIQYLLGIQAMRGWNFDDQYTFKRFCELITIFVFRSLGVQDPDLLSR